MSLPGTEFYKLRDSDIPCTGVAFGKSSSFIAVLRLVQYRLLCESRAERGSHTKTGGFL
jgi:hypothetical protein